MNVLNKFENLRTQYKVILLIIILALTAICTFLIYNRHTLALPEEDRWRVLSYTQEDDNRIRVNFDGDYLQYLNINYNDPAGGGDLRVKFEELGQDDICYSHLHKCGFVVRSNINSITLDLDKDVEITSITVDNNPNFNFRVFAFWSIILLLLFLLFAYKTFWMNNLHFLALLVCLSIGSIFLICAHNMTSTTMDDDTHYSRVSSFSIYTEADYDSWAYKVFFNYLRTPDEVQEYQNYLNKKSVQPIGPRQIGKLMRPDRISYIPMAVTVAIARKTGLNFTTSFMLGRIVNLLIYACVVTLAVWIMPRYKLLTSLVALLPTCIFLASNYNYDATVIGFSLLAFAIFMKEYLGRGKIELKNLLFFTLAGIYAALPKMVYAPLLLLGLLLPAKRFKSKKQCIIFRAIICAIVIMCLLSYVFPILLNGAGDPRGGATSEIGQVGYILSHPMEFAGTFLRSVIMEIPAKIFSPDSLARLAYYNQNASAGVNSAFILMLFALIIAFLGERVIPKIKKVHRCFVMVLCFLVISLFSMAMYIDFTPVGLKQINGIASRYFVPLMMPIAIFGLSNTKLKNKLSQQNTMLLSIFLCIISYGSIIYSYIINVYCL